MPQFNPYHFIPVEKVHRGAPSSWPIAEPPPQARHDQYLRNAHSGRILCHLVTETPIFIGAERGTPEDDASAIPVAGFDLEGAPAVPASSLRGMIGGIIEAVTGSAMRILDNTALMYRRPWSRRPSGPKQLLAGYVFDFFGSVDPEALPFSSKRSLLTAAEVLLGFVGEEQEAAAKSGEASSSRALAGRLRFSHARDPISSQGESLRQPTRTLKVLDSPKPPCPALYFMGNQGEKRYIRKSDLRPGNGRPQGRKYFLHHFYDRDAPGWVSNYCDPPHQPTMQCRVSVIPEGVRFTFAVDFDNLTEHELGMLCFALRPSERFRHKCGMGRSIGLGTVRIEPVAILAVDRSQRYTARGFNQPRYRPHWIKAGAVADELPPRFDRERSALGSVSDTRDDGAFEALRSGFETYANATNPSATKALLMLGQKVNMKNVHVPVCRGGHAELETFKWFVYNDQLEAGNQALTPLATTDRIPPLDENGPVARAH